MSSQNSTINRVTTIYATTLQQGLDYKSAGAKAANLGRAIGLGMTVPPGGVITRQALRLFLEESGLLASAERVITSRGEDRATRATMYKALCANVMEAPMPTAISKPVAALVATILDQAPHGLAVRSSGVHEDSATASFAGVYDSFLGLRTEAEMWTAVRRCWCSAWSPQAVDYVHRLEIELTVEGMGVLLQALVGADVAGVLFTADPRTGNPWQFMLEASFGLARDLVASTGTTPVDRFLFEWDTGEILERSTARKRAALVPGVSGIDSVDVPDERQTEPSLSDGLATRVAQVGLQLDRAFSTRVDVEWAVAGGEIHIVQVRPITALPAFFPHVLPAHLTDKTWLPAKQWNFSFRVLEGRVTPPLYRDKFITEKFNRYLQLGPIEMPVHRLSGAEMDFHGHRYLVADEHLPEGWPGRLSTDQESYLIEYEPRMRAEYLHDIYSRFPAAERRAMRLIGEATTTAEAIEAILWAREEAWGFLAITAGPSQQCTTHACVC